MSQSLIGNVIVEEKRDGETIAIRSQSLIGNVILPQVQLILGISIVSQSLIGNVIQYNGFKIGENGLKRLNPS